MCCDNSFGVLHTKSHSLCWQYHAGGGKSATVEGTLGVCISFGVNSCEVVEDDVDVISISLPFSDTSVDVGSCVSSESGAGSGSASGSASESGSSSGIIVGVDTAANVGIGTGEEEVEDDAAGDGLFCTGILKGGISQCNRILGGADVIDVGGIDMKGNTM
jgi:hypothetical protein